MDNLYYASDKTILFQRLSVEVTDLVLILSLAYYFGCSSPNQTLAFLLCIFAPGFLIVVHIHFQYNGYLVGLYILSVVLLVTVLHFSLSIELEPSFILILCILIHNAFKTSLYLPSTFLLDLSPSYLLY